jgi:N-acyl-D-amino-acid deacylase
MITYHKGGAAVLDLVVRRGLVCDGTGSPAFVADVAVRDGLIVEVGTVRDADAPKQIDAAGRVVAPGFIDAHAHSDLALLDDPWHAGKLAQGITTDIIGQDGLSFAPLDPELVRFYRDYLSGIGRYSAPVDGRTVASYLAAFDRRVAVNVAYLVPHGTVRLQTRGMRDGALDSDEMAAAAALIRAGIADGAAGFSTGLSYFPGSFGDTEELVALCGVLRDVGGVYVTHVRTSFGDQRVDPIDEALEIGRRAGVPVHFSHLRTGPGSPRPGAVERLLGRIDAAVAEGADVTLDTYPYGYGNGLAIVDLPRWFHQGSVDDMLGRLADPAQRSRIKAEMTGVRSDLGATSRCYSYFGSGEHRDLLGLSYREAAEARGYEDPDDLLLDLLLDERLAVGQVNEPPDADVARVIEDENLEILGRDYAMVGSDGIHAGRHSHPRTFGAFARLLGPMRRRSHFRLETMVNRMTGRPAQRFGLADRGVVAVGRAADLVVFDPDAIVDNATWESPSAPATGVDLVVVNGQVAYADGKPTGELRGRALTSQPARAAGSSR